VHDVGSYERHVLTLKGSSHRLRDTGIDTLPSKARATPRNPIPTETPPERNLAANTALPQPPKTNQNVPIISAAKR